VSRALALLLLLAACSSGGSRPGTSGGVLCPPADTRDCQSVQASWTRLDVCLQPGAAVRDLDTVLEQAEKAAASWTTLRSEPLPHIDAILVAGVPGARIAPSAAGVTCSTRYVRVGEVYLAGGHETLRHELVHVLCLLGRPRGIPCATVEHPGSVDLGGRPIN